MLFFLFKDDLIHVGKSSSVSLDNIQRVLKQIENNLCSLENELQNSNSSDESTDTLKIFLNTAKEEYLALQSMSSQLETLYSDLSEYFVFDKQKYMLEHFLEDIRKFLDNFKHV